MPLGALFLATYRNPTSGQEAEIRIRQVATGYRVMAFLSALHDGDEVTAWEEVTATEAEARKVTLRWRTTLALDYGMQQTTHAAGPSATRTAQEPWGGKTLRWGTDEG
jgi:hypothetical protein